MAGGFLNIAEAAVHLNISEDAIKKLVDQRKLFPLRDTSGLKFKPDELNRYLEDQNDASETQDDSLETIGSDISLDGLELDLSDGDSGTSNQNALEEPPASEVKPVSEATAEPDLSEVKATSEIGLADLDSGLSLEGSGSLSDSSAIGATGILPIREDEGSLLIGGDIDEADLDVPATLLGASGGLSNVEEKEITPQQQDIANAQSIVLGDDIDLSGIDVDLSDASNAEQLEGAESPQSLVLGDSLAGDIESIVATSDILIDEGLASVILEADEAGSFIVEGSDSKKSNELSGIIDSDQAIEGSNIGSSLSGESGVFMEGGLSLEGGEVKAWDVDLGEFLNDVEEDPDAATMLGTANEFNLDAEGSSADDPSQSADLASSQAGDSMFDKSAGPGDSSFFGEEVDQNASPLTAGSEMLSSSQFMGAIDDAHFNGWQVTGLICCAFLLLLGGLLTFDLVRTIGSSADTSLSNPLVGGLSQIFGWRQ